MVEGNRQRHIIGSPERVVTLLRQLVADTSADELMVTTMVFGEEERRRSYELLARHGDLDCRWKDIVLASTQHTVPGRSEATRSAA